jgi:hypothetical protein
MTNFQMRPEFRFETHLRRTRQFLTGNRTNDHAAICDAHHFHSLSVLEGSHELHTRAVSVGSSISEENAKVHVLQGLGRRTRTVWNGLRKIYHQIEPDRKQPLTSDENTELSDIINSIYINLRGSCDNAAWAILALTFPSAKLKPVAIGLFDERWQKAIQNELFVEKISAYLVWFNELKDRRDPAAHRVPLSFIPAILSEEDLQQRNVLTQEVNNLYSSLRNYQDNIAKMKILEEVGLRLERIEKLGDFLPLFQYDPTQQPVPLYPTLVEDIANYIEIIDMSLSFLESLAASRTTSELNK